MGILCIFMPSGGKIRIVVKTKNASRKNLLRREYTRGTTQIAINATFRLQ